MKTLLYSSLLFCFSSSKTATTYVYYCDSPNGKKYHFTESCKGLQKCTHDIVKTTLTDAKQRKLTVCLFED